MDAMTLMADSSGELIFSRGSEVSLRCPQAQDMHLLDGWVQDLTSRRLLNLGGKPAEQQLRALIQGGISALVVSAKTQHVLGFITAYDVNMLDRWCFLLTYLRDRDRGHAAGLSGTFGFWNYLFDSMRMRKVYFDVFESNSGWMDSLPLLEIGLIRKEGQFRVHVATETGYEDVSRFAVHHRDFIRARDYLFPFWDWSNQRKEVALLRRYFILPGLVGLAVLAIVVVFLQTTGAIPAKQRETYSRPSQLSPDEIRELSADVEAPLNAPDVRVSPGASVSEEELQRHGVYRIVPASYVGELSYDEVDASAAVETGVESSDPVVLRNSPLFIYLGDLVPDGFVLSTIDTYDGDNNTVVRQVYRNDEGAYIEVMRTRRFHEPVDMYAPATDGKSALDMRLTTLAGKEAIIFSPSPKAGTRFLLAQVIFHSDGIDTALLAEGVATETVIALADSLAEVVGGA